MLSTLGQEMGHFDEMQDVQYTTKSFAYCTVLNVHMSPESLLIYLMFCLTALIINPDYYEKKHFCDSKRFASMI